jgi:hypothetical protein
MGAVVQCCKCRTSSQRVPFWESDLPLYCKSRQRAQGLLAPQMRILQDTVCVMHTLQLLREHYPQNRVANGCEKRRITRSRRDTTSAFGAEERKVESILNNQAAACHLNVLMDSDRCYLLFIAAAVYWGGFYHEL